MTNWKFEGELTEDEFMKFILEMEKDNLDTVNNKAEKKEMVRRIEASYEGAKKRDN